MSLLYGKAKKMPVMNYDKIMNESTSYCSIAAVAGAALITLLCSWTLLPATIETSSILFIFSFEINDNHKTSL
jgi:hypothetical protein